MGTKLVQKIEEGGCRRDQRATLILAFKRGRQQGTIGGWSEMVCWQARVSRQGWADAGRWRRQRANLIFAPLAMPLAWLLVHI